MRDAAEEYSALKQNWFVIEFSQLGFIGKLFRTRDLSILIQFFLTFFNDKPVDWLLEDIIDTKICKQNQVKTSHVQVKYNQSLFQHMGTQSSLIGKVQKHQSGSGPCQ